MDKEKKNGKKNLVITMAVAIMLLVGVAISYAYISVFGRSQNQEISLTAGSLHLIFDDEDDSNIEGSLKLGGSITKNFSIENTGVKDAYANIYWENLINTYLPQSLTYTLEYKESTGNTWLTTETKSANVPRSMKTSSKVLADKVLIPKGKKYLYKLTITLQNLANINQISDLEAILSSKFSIEESKTEEEVKTKLIARAGSTDKTKIWEHAREVSKIVLEDKLLPKENATYTYDMSEAQDGSIMAYYVPTVEDATMYTLYIQGDGKIYANENSSYFFRNFYVEEIEGIELLDTSLVTDMSYMFTNTDVISLDLSTFDTSNVTTMNGMFSGMELLESLNLSSFDTSNVVDMAGMFNRIGNSSKVINLDLSAFDTSNVTDMSYMFNESNLKTVNLDSFNTSKVTNMASMFFNCQSLASLDINHFDTSSVTNMASMFGFCSNLTLLDVSHFNTSSVTSMESMFSNCSKLTSLDVTNFNTHNVTKMNSMFSNCQALTSLDLSAFDTSKVTEASQMFYWCTTMTSLNLSNWNTSSITGTFDTFWVIPETIKITVNSESTKSWILNNKTNNPTLTEANIIMA